MTEKSAKTGIEGQKLPSFLITIRTVLREGGIPLALILLTALAVKIVFQVQFESHNPLSQFPISDELLYIETADHIAGGQLSPGTVFHSAPLYPYLIAPIFLICGPDPMPVRLVQALLGVGSILLLYLITRFFFSRPWALAAALAMLLYYPFTFFEGKVLIVTSAVFYLNLGLLFLVGLHRIHRIPLAIYAGIALGVAAALRPNLLLLLPAVVVWIYWAGRRGRRLILSLGFLLGAAGPIAPITLHNYLVEDDFVLLSDNGGVNFYFGNNPSAGGSFQVDDPRWGHIEHQFFTAKQIAEADTGEILKPSEVSDYWMGKGYSFIRENPFDYLLLLGRKLKSFLENFEYGIIYTPPAERDLTWILQLLFLPFGVFISGTMLGLAALASGIAGRRRQDPMNEQRDVPAETPTTGPWMLILAVLAVHVVSVLLFFNYSRFRLTAFPSMILLGLLGCRYCWIWIRSHRWMRVLFGLAAAGFGVLCAWAPSPFEDADMRQWRMQYAHGLATVATAFGKGEQYDEADRAFTRALDVGPELDIILSKRGRMRLDAGNYEGARIDLERALELQPGFPLHLGNLADYYTREGAYRDLDRAAHLIRQALAKPGLSPTYQVYLRMIEGNIHMERGDCSLAVGAYETAYTLAPYLTEALYLQGLAHKRLGETERAQELFQRCLEADPGHAGALKELGR